MLSPGISTPPDPGDQRKTQKRQRGGFFLLALASPHPFPTRGHVSMHGTTRHQAASDP